MDHRLEANLFWPARHGKNEAGADYQVLEKDERLLASLPQRSAMGKIQRGGSTGYTRSRSLILLYPKASFIILNALQIEQDVLFQEL